MRVVSQDGRLDYPYDKSVIFLNPINKSAVSIQLSGDKEVTTLGQYSTKERALKAMEMLRKSWLRESVEFENGFYNKNCVFQFPADKDIEIMY